MASLLREGSGMVLIRIEDILQQYEASLKEEQREVSAWKNDSTHVKQWKTKQGIMRVKQAEPAAAPPVS